MQRPALVLGGESLPSRMETVSGTRLSPPDGQASPRKCPFCCVCPAAPYLCLKSRAQDSDLQTQQLRADRERRGLQGVLFQVRQPQVGQGSKKPQLQTMPKPWILSSHQPAIKVGFLIIFTIPYSFAILNMFSHYLGPVLDTFASIILFKSHNSPQR